MPLVASYLSRVTQPVGIRQQAAALKHADTAEDAPYYQPTDAPEHEESEDPSRQRADRTPRQWQGAEILDKHPDKRHGHERAEEDGAPNLRKACNLCGCVHLR